MQKLILDLENCYGIKNLQYTFDFSKERTFLIYAPNGVMKTSLAKAFKDLSKNEKSKDLIYPENETKRNIKSEAGIDLTSEEVFVVEPYNDQFNSDKISSLLVKKELKERYDYLHKQINTEKEIFLKNIKEISGLRRNDNIEEEIKNTFNTDFFDIIEGVENAVRDFSNLRDCQVFSDKYINFSKIKYSEIFNNKVLELLNKKEFKIQLKMYIDIYNNLINTSAYFRKDFNYYNASNIQKSLNANNFFKYKHSVNFFDGSKDKEISTTKDFEDLIKKEQERVLNDNALKEQFEKIDNELSSHTELRKFRDYILDKKEILLELENLEQFKKDLWLSYFIKCSGLFFSLLSSYKEGKIEIQKIIEEAKKEGTDWETVVNIFNQRFSVPFELEIKNKDDVILKSSVPTINFIFKDSNGKKNIEREKLLKDVLSQGERRAFYILYIIFEIQTRKNLNQKSIFIVDDIADSFDYKNKYAIIEYLNDVKKEPYFYQIILTHNFDFFRTIQSRILDTAKWNNSLIAQKEHGVVKFLEGGSKNICNPFENWKNSINSNLTIVIASIPIIRNLIEYKEGNKAKNYILLTHLLHQKEERILSDGSLPIKKTDDIELGDIEPIYKDVLRNIDFSHLDKTQKIKDILYNQADNIINTNFIDNEIILENKIVLSIAIRIKAEEFMWSKILDKNPINGAQTAKLYDRYKQEFQSDTKKIKNINLLEQVNLMTPENIHLNSFMYEPILDMSNLHLKSLYTKLSEL